MCQNVFYNDLEDSLFDIINSVNTHMPTTHYMMLHPGPFADIASGMKKSELRVNDAKRRLLAIGDVIEFTSREDTLQKVLVTITSLITYPNFRELYRAHAEEYTQWSEEEFVNGFPYYSPAEIEENGVVCIGIELKT
jgi:ASC-1-like (ASCH) protein